MPEHQQNHLYHDYLSIWWKGFQNIVNDLGPTSLIDFPSLIQKVKLILVERED